MAETDKKAKAPAKPRAATAKKEAATPKATTSKTAANGSTKKATPIAKAATRMPTHDEIAHLARKYWAERGHADGHAEQDWLRAEQELTQKAS